MRLHGLTGRDYRRSRVPCPPPAASKIEVAATGFRWSQNYMMIVIFITCKMQVISYSVDNRLRATARRIKGGGIV